MRKHQISLYIQKKEKKISINMTNINNRKNLYNNYNGNIKINEWEEKKC